MVPVVLRLVHASRVSLERCKCLLRSRNISRIQGRLQALQIIGHRRNRARRSSRGRLARRRGPRRLLYILRESGKGSFGRCNIPGFQRTFQRLKVFERFLEIVLDGERRRRPTGTNA